MNIDLKQLQTVIREEVRSILLPQFTTVTRQYKKDGSVVTVADHQLQQHLTKVLQQFCPDIALLGEEMSIQHQQQLINSNQPLWCLDPIDGTSNFASGMPYFSVSLALLNHGEALVGIVYDPILDEIFAAQKGQGAWLNGQALHAKPSGLDLQQTIAIIDFKRLPKALSRKMVTDLPYGSQRSLGSIALELCWLAAGRGHIYLHGKQHLWDYAAAQLILAEAGGYACTLEGDPLKPNTLKPQSTCASIDENLFKAWYQYLVISGQQV